jgi:predicted phosphodiesterase
MPELRWAALSDIHGNRWALEEVLEDVRRRGIEDIVGLGDSLYGPLDPRGTAGILMEMNPPAVRGNEDRIITDPPRGAPESQTLDFVRRNLEPDHISWLAGLPPTRVVHDEIFLCHGTPKRDDEYLLHSVTESGAVPRTAGDLAGMLEGIGQRVVLCGHDHVPRVVRLPGGRMVVNPGSVGCPAFSDDRPFPHDMENGAPHARYAVVSKDTGGWRAEIITVPYDWEAAARTAESNGRPDWAVWLRTGQVTR